jgi:cytochrome c oxidase cbb3-type subunit 3
MTSAGAAVLGAVLLVLIAGCEREQRRFAEIAPSSSRPPDARPAGVNPYEENAWAVSEGQRLYVWFNCQGCHSMGGGGMGPALMDDAWIYGAEPADVFTSIVEGRPNGMPAFGDKVPAQQVWQLVAYVRSLGALTRKDVRPGRADTMQVRPAPQSTAPAAPIRVAPPATAEPRG